ncbi:16S rRNA (guanine(966)-N(2))-methyltransferase RsmD [Paenibacillus lemnae]|uniref:16S rRNA (Guanine(966)-N(2))-methyltransferase RsmD n=1 Tax=Paenibacillus lemnae TaxID=1330551 RepID=A0A848MAJ7_PAELE|nr:16S rRNA (guanine(966)-N(2))-methyltransferase RsmD [Paenibacillus lemnae]NMO96494.1 16S rRNA (guanine(966)-N(2))-methyltransferase RsmD [Paenibacillus lemnae]
MRVISGSAKGRPLKSVPGTGTRPTTDKVKEAIFSMIGPYFDGGTTLDLFAGTGGLGIESMSRGIEKAVFIDTEPKSIETIRYNLNAAGFERQAEVFRNDAARALKVLQKRDYRFDLVFLDPPYRMTDADALMLDMISRGLLNPGALVVLEYGSSHTYPEQLESFHHLRSARYGETSVSIYEYAPTDSKPDLSGEEVF